MLRVQSFSQSQSKSLAVQICKYQFIHQNLGQLICFLKLFPTPNVSLLSSQSSVIRRKVKNYYNCKYQRYGITLSSSYTNRYHPAQLIYVNPSKEGVKLKGQNQKPSDRRRKKKGSIEDEDNFRLSEIYARFTPIFQFWRRKTSWRGKQRKEGTLHFYSDKDFSLMYVHILVFIFPKGEKSSCYCQRM